MNEETIYGKLLEADVRLEHVETLVSELPTRTEINGQLDKILHIVERLDLEKTVANYRLDTHDVKIAKLEQQISAT